MSKIKLFTHTDLDGIGCVILAYLAFGRENVDVEYCNYDDVDEKVKEHYLYNEIHYDRMYITDISVGEEVAQGIDTWIAKDHVRLLDHHATALWLNQYDWCKVRVKNPGYGLDHFSWYEEFAEGFHIRMKTCGTELFCYQLLSELGESDIGELDLKARKNVDRFVQIVRDYDTWRWVELGEEGVVCKQVNDLFYMYGREEFITWVMNQIEYAEQYPPFPHFGEEEKALLEQKQKDIDHYIEKKDKQITIMKDSFGFTCGVVFAEQYFSELGNRLCEMHSELDYVAMINVSNGTVSYRTVKEDIDLGGEIAHSFGGGGHKKAAGSTFDGDGMREMIVRSIFIPDETREHFVETISDKCRRSEEGLYSAVLRTR